MRGKFLQVPFALSGDVTPIPDDAQVDNSVSFETGWGPDYQADQETDPNAKPIDRAETNYLFNALTTLLRFWQTETFPEWIAPADNDGVAFPYEEGTIVRYRATGGDPFVNWVNTAPNNIVAPGGAGWRLLSEVTNALSRAGGVMTGAVALAADSTSTTAPQFDNDTSIVNTAFAKRMGKEFSGVTTVAATGAVALTAIGGVVKCTNVAAITLTLPNTTDVPLGATIQITNLSLFDVTVQRAGTNTMTADGQSTPSSFFIRPGETMELTCDIIGANGRWLATGSAMDKYTGFVSALSTNGWQKLPGGLILQWGIGSASTGAGFTNLFPIVFPSACVAVNAMHFGSDGSVNIIAAGVGANGAVFITDYTPSTVSVYYVALGF